MSSTPDNDQAIFLDTRTNRALVIEADVRKYLFEMGESGIACYVVVLDLTESTKGKPITTQDIATVLGVSKQTVKATTRRLESIGLITIERPVDANGGSLPTIYRLINPPEGGGVKKYTPPSDFNTPIQPGEGGGVKKYTPPLRLIGPGQIPHQQPESPVSENVASRAHTHAHTRTRLDQESSSSCIPESSSESSNPPTPRIDQKIFSDSKMPNPHPTTPQSLPTEHQPIPGQDLQSPAYNPTLSGPKNAAQPMPAPSAQGSVPSDGGGKTDDNITIDDLLNPKEIVDHPMAGLGKMAFFPVKDDEKKVWDRAFKPGEAKEKKAELEAKGFRLLRGRDLQTPEFANYSLNHFKPKRERDLVFDAIAETQFNMKPGFNPDALNGHKGQVGAVVAAFAALFEVTVGVLNKDAARAAEIRKCLRDYNASGYTIQMRRPEAYIAWWGKWDTNGRRPLPVAPKEPKELTAADLYADIHSRPSEDETPF